jgi:antitoxin component YwqK of YwqJK toxin-antitoxin module
MQGVHASLGEILADRAGELKAKYPQYGTLIDELVARGLTKYLSWAVKQVLQRDKEGEDDPDTEEIDQGALLDALKTFDQKIQRFEHKDINEYTASDLIQAVHELQPSKKEMADLLKRGTTKVYEDDTTLVLHISTKEACQLYGKGTQWCIAATTQFPGDVAQHAFDEYKDVQGSQIYVIINKKFPAEDPRHKEAVLVYPHHGHRDEPDEFDYTFAIYDATDRPRGNLVGLEDKEATILNLLQQDAATRPVSPHVNPYSNERFQALVKDTNGTGVHKPPGGGEWHYRGYKVHRDDGPAYISPNGDEYWLQNDVVHRADGGPAVVLRNQDGSVRQEEWKENGLHHRDNGPASISYHPNGMLQQGTWYQRGQQHRTDGPARVVYDPGGKKLIEEWKQDARMHREDGPAFINYAYDPPLERWFVRGNEYEPPTKKESTFVVESLRELLADKASDLKKQHPQLANVIDTLVQQDLKKYLAWTVKQLLAGADAQTLIPALAAFDTNLQRIEQRDINKYDAASLIATINKLPASKKQRDEVIKQGAAKVWSKDGLLLLYIGTKAASKLYGAGTRWCITMRDEDDPDDDEPEEPDAGPDDDDSGEGEEFDDEDDEFDDDDPDDDEMDNPWDEYHANGAVFYFLINNNLDPKNPFYKQAIVTYPWMGSTVRQNYSQYKEFEIFDAEDNVQPSIEGKVATQHENEIIQIVRQDAVKHPPDEGNPFEQEGLRKMVEPTNGTGVWRSKDGTQERHYKNYKLHRDDGPAHFRNDAEIYESEWYQNGELHRVGGPASHHKSNDKNGTYGDYEQKVWAREGEKHRDDGPAYIEHMDDRDTQHWWRNGKLHRDGAPAVIGKNRNGDYEEWHQNGQSHRVGAPARIERNPAGQVTQESWFQNGLYIRPEGPSLVMRDDTGRVISEGWTNEKGEPHRKDGPARWTNDGGRKEESWWENGKQHREGAPARIAEYSNGMREEHWHEQGHAHRTDGPHYMAWYGSGKPKEERWAVNGIHYRPDGPSHREWDEQGEVIAESWTNSEGRLHRDDGPARWTKDEYGNVYENWYQDGEFVKREMRKEASFVLESLRELLADKAKDLKAKYPQLESAIDSLVEAGLKKYLPWAVKQLLAGADPETLYPALTQFDQNTQRLEQKDINKYDAASLLAAVSALAPSKKQREEKIKQGAAKIWESDNLSLLRIDTAAASQIYGRGTKWCISGFDHADEGTGNVDPAHHFNRYLQDGAIFYFLLNNALTKRSPAYKQAIAVYPWMSSEEKASAGNVEIYDAKDNGISKLKGVSSAQAEQLLRIVRTDAAQQSPPDSNPFENKGLQGLVEETGGTGVWRSKDGTEVAYYKNWEPHRDDGPAFVSDTPERHVEWWYQNGTKHRDDGPAYISRPQDVSDTNAVFEEEWLRDGKFHRKGGPAIVRRNVDGPGSYEAQWYVNDKHHRKDGPAYISNHSDEQEELWAQNDKLHRIGGPARIHQFGEEKTEEWHQNGQLHRNDGPSTSHWVGDKLVVEQWHQKGELHREGGPARSEFDETGKPHREQWFRKGEEIEPNEGKTDWDKLIPVSKKESRRTRTAVLAELLRGDSTIGGGRK